MLVNHVSFGTQTLNSQQRASQSPRFGELTGADDPELRLACTALPTVAGKVIRVINEPGAWWGGDFALEVAVHPRENRAHRLGATVDRSRMDTAVLKISMQQDELAGYEPGQTLILKVKPRRFATVRGNYVEVATDSQPARSIFPAAHIGASLV